MKNTINQNLAHQYLIAEFTLRTLERDLKHLNDLKTATVIEKLYESAKYALRNHTLQAIEIKLG